MNLNNYYPFYNTPLPYEYYALEPYIDTKTMELHHDRHLQTYIDVLNLILKDNPAYQKMSLTELNENIKRLPKNLQVPIQDTAGGVYNHRFFFNGMTPDYKDLSDGLLKEQLEKDFRNEFEFIKQFREAALNVFGSGYAWLIYKNGKLSIHTTPNQNNPLTNGQCPLLTIDVWEHAYYLRHYNERLKYVEDWLKLINWKKVEENFVWCKNRNKNNV